MTETKAATVKAAPAGKSAAVKKAEAAQAQPVKATVNACLCGCGGSTGSKFQPGHDARHAGNLKRAYAAGDLSRDDAVKAAEAVSPNFGSKVRRMLDLADQAIAKAVKAEAAEAAK